MAKCIPMYGHNSNFTQRIVFKCKCRIAHYIKKMPARVESSFPRRGIHDPSPVYFEPIKKITSTTIVMCEIQLNMNGQKLINDSLLEQFFLINNLFKILQLKKYYIIDFLHFPWHTILQNKPRNCLLQDGKMYSTNAPTSTQLKFYTKTISKCKCRIPHHRKNNTPATFDFPKIHCVFQKQAQTLDASFKSPFFTNAAPTPSRVESSLPRRGIHDPSPVFRLFCIH